VSRVADVQLEQTAVTFEGIDVPRRKSRARRLAHHSKAVVRLRALAGETQATRPPTRLAAQGDLAIPTFSPFSPVGGGGGNAGFAQDDAFGRAVLSDGQGSSEDGESETNPLGYRGSRTATAAHSTSSMSCLTTSTLFLHSQRCATPNGHSPRADGGEDPVALWVLQHSIDVGRAPSTPSTD
jgi:hypothetical protein